jgi:Acyl-CoA reductase (LuxC)
MVAVMGWDAEDGLLQKRFYEQADVVMASAGDDVIGRVAQQMATIPGDRRLQPHGHKVAFTAISRDTLQLQHIGDDIGWSPPGGTEIIDIIALLAALDSAFWDQNSCGSSRVHFVEQGSMGDDLLAEYARRLTYRMRQIATVIPRGAAWPVRRLHDAYDRYKSIEGTDRWGTGLRVISDYDDPFVVILDERTSEEFRMDPRVFASIVNECHTRVVMVRPVDDIMDVPWRYLKMLPRRSLQSVSLAAGLPGQGLTRQILAFARACASRGVTAIRLTGAGPFPSLTHSWDGMLPLDLVGRRPPGYFSTIEFDSPFEEMIEIYRGHLARLAKIPPVDRGGLVTPI